MPIDYTPDTVWPPKPYDVALDTMALHDALYVGDPAGLAVAFDRQRTLTAARPGVWGRIRSWWGGSPAETSSQSTRLHVPVPADIATVSADLLFADPPKIEFPTEDGPDGKAVKHPLQERLDQLVGTDQFKARLLEAAEVGAAISGVFLRVAWDQDIAQVPIIGVFGADRAIPEFKHGHLRAVTFWTVVEDNTSTVWRHLERHEPGMVYHALFQGTSQNLGRPMSLADHKVTEGLADLVDEHGGIPTGATRPTAVYVPNILPQRRWRTTPGLEHLGRSDFDGVEGLFDAIDEAWSSWLRDVRLGKARVFVDQTMLDADGPGKGASFDTEAELFAPLDIGGSMKDNAPLITYQPNIRYAEHQATVQALVHEALRAAGYSPSTFGDTGDGVQTATEVSSKDRSSARTRDKKIRYWAAALAELAVTMLEVDAHVFGGHPAPEADVLPDVVFPDASQPDIEVLARTTQSLRTVQAMSIRTAVETNHPDWDRQRVDDEVNAIQAEQSAALAPDPFTLRPGIDDATDPHAPEVEPAVPQP